MRWNRVAGLSHLGCFRRAYPLPIPNSFAWRLAGLTLTKTAPNVTFRVVVSQRNERPNNAVKPALAAIKLLNPCLSVHFRGQESAYRFKTTLK